MSTISNDNFNHIPLDNLKSDLEYMEKNSLSNKNIWGDKDWNNILNFSESEKNDTEKNDTEKNIININNRINNDENITQPPEEIKVNNKENISENINSVNSKINFNNSVLSLNISKIKKEIEEKTRDQLIVKTQFNEKLKNAMDFQKHKLNFKKMDK